MTDKPKRPKRPKNPPTPKGAPTPAARTAPNLHVRISDTERAAIESAAARVFLTVSQWTRQTLLLAAGADPEVVRRSL
jgi:hypothetical protein